MGKANLFQPFIYSVFFLNKHEASEDAKPAWFFKDDIVNRVRDIGVPIPMYDSEDRSLDLVVKHKKIPITGYRILVSVSTASFGLAKATLSYKGFAMAPHVVDWVYGVIVTVRYVHWFWHGHCNLLAILIPCH
jgi:hypothetical protein